MAVPNKKMYDRKGKLVFDPNNPEDVRNYKEKQPLMEALKLVQGLADPRGGAGLTGMTRVISKAFGAKAAKALFKQNKAKQLADLVTKPMTRGKKAVSNTRKQATPTVKEVVETKPTIPTTVPTSGSTVSDKIKSLSNAEIKAFENVKNVRELAEKQAKNAPTTTTPKLTNAEIKAFENVKNARELAEKQAKSIRNSWEYNNTGRDYYIDGVEGFRKAGTEAKSIVSRLKDREAAKNAAKKAFEENNPEIIKKSNAQTAMSIAALTSVIGGGAGATYYGMQLSNKDNKKTTTPQKTGPVDLKRIDKSKLKDSNIEGVKTIRGSDGKDYGIQWNNTTKSWDYYRGDKTKKTETPKPDLKREDVGGGYTPIKDNEKTTGTGGGNQTTTTGGTGSTKPTTTPTVTTTPLIGDEYYKKNSELATLRQQDDDRQLLARAEAQKKEMMEFEPTEALPTKPLSSLVFKTSPATIVNKIIDEQASLKSIRADNKLPLKKKRYGGNLAMLKYMK